MLNWLNTYRRYACDINRINQEAARSPEDLVLTVEKIFRSDLRQITERILSIPVRRHIIFLSGPSSSGKTTCAKKLAEEFENSGSKAIMISMDDFYLGAEMVERLPNGKPDFESVNALDIDLMRQCVAEIAACGECDIPRYDFGNSRRREDKRHIRLEDDSVVIIEGIHALNPIFGDIIPKEYLSRIYIGVKQGIKDNEDYVLHNREVRLLRRLVRDSRFRETPPEKVLDMWDEVVDGETRYIRPYRYTSDFTVNTIHIYEPCVMKRHAVPLLRSIGEDSSYYDQAQHLIRELGRFADIDESLVPENSLLREFFGGGIYEY